MIPRRTAGVGFGGLRRGWEGFGGTRLGELRCTKRCDELLEAAGVVDLEQHAQRREYLPRARRGEVREGSFRGPQDVIEESSRRR